MIMEISPPVKTFLLERRVKLCHHENQFINDVFVWELIETFTDLDLAKKELELLTINYSNSIHRIIEVLHQS